jgi:hypothetical protein
MNESSPTEDIMLKHLSICAALIAFGAGTAAAQQANEDIVMQKLDVPGANFHIIVSMTKSQAKTVRLRGETASWTIYPIGGELAHARSDEIEKLFNNHPIHAFQVDRSGAGSRQAVAVYLIPNGTLAVSAEK